MILITIQQQHSTIQQFEHNSQYIIFTYYEHAISPTTIQLSPISLLPTNPTNQHESFQRVLSSLARLPGNLSVGHPSQNCSKSSTLNCGVLMERATEKKMHLIDIGLQLNDDQIKNLTLIEIEKHVERNIRTLKDFKGFPYPSGYVVEQLGNRLIYDELNYNADSLAVEFQQLFRSLTGLLPFGYVILKG
ncbi:hypothetical protein MTR_3g045530 [Medicago truncatula]|uniref:Uncharacterized protein n=1 Tax=Medicago truncatula TaxID=3880 RepID=A0A072UV86_MEDTR|nr:hypothetical protein MTR_3g045530 [Medicago truncatula]